MIELGSIVKDRITGFTGVAVSRHQYLTGCDRYTVQPQKLTAEGKPAESQWYDENQLLVVTPASKMETKFVEEPKAARKTGGPRGEMPRRSL